MRRNREGLGYASTQSSTGGCGSSSISSSTGGGAGGGAGRTQGFLHSYMRVCVFVSITHQHSREDTLLSQMEQTTSVIPQA